MSVFLAIISETGRFLKKTSKIEHLVANDIQRIPGRDIDRILENSSIFGLEKSVEKIGLALALIYI